MQGDSLALEQRVAVCLPALQLQLSPRRCKGREWQSAEETRLDSPQELLSTPAKVVSKTDLRHDSVVWQKQTENINRKQRGPAFKDTNPILFLLRLSHFYQHLKVCSQRLKWQNRFSPSHQPSPASSLLLCTHFTFIDKPILRFFPKHSLFLLHFAPRCVVLLHKNVSQRPL